METVTDLIKNTPIPKMVRVRQKYDRSCIPLEEIPEKLREQLSRPSLLEKIQPGMRIAITCGSRGINHYAIMDDARITLSY